MLVLLILCSKNIPVDTEAGSIGLGGVYVTLFVICYQECGSALSTIGSGTI